MTDMSVEQWLAILSDRVIFWLHPAKLHRLLGALHYRTFEQDVLIIDTKSLLDAHEANVRLSPINGTVTLVSVGALEGSVG